MTTPAEIAYSEGTRALDRQEAAVDGLRSRSSGLFAAATIAVGLFTTQGISKNLGFLVAAVSMVVVIIAALMVHRPVGWYNNVNARQLLARIDAESLDLEGVHRLLADDAQAMFENNHAVVEKLTRWYIAELAALGLLVVGLAASVAFA